MPANVTALLPEIIRQVADALRTASPALLIVVGAALFFLSGALKWVIKWIGAGLVIYGLLLLLGYL